MIKDHMFNYFKNRQIIKETAQKYYKAAQTQARQPIFYEQYNVPDTPYGRFDMIALHCYLLVRRLNKVGDPKTAQSIFDIMFKTLDLAMREMGVSDLAVPKKMKKFMQAFNGRAHEYEKAFQSGDDNALVGAIRRNIYGTADDVSEADLKGMASYIMMNTDLKLEGTEFIKPKKKRAVA